MTSPTDLLSPLPIVDITDDRLEAPCDWKYADYSTELTETSPGCYDVRHRLSGAAGVSDLLRRGDAQWCVEIRCPGAMHSETVLSSSPTTPVKLEPKTSGTGTVYLWPGIVTVRDCLLNASDTHLWSNSGGVRVAKGRYLVRGAPIEVQRQGSDPLVFRWCSDIEPEDAVSVTLEADTNDVHKFVIRARPDRLLQLRDDDRSLLGCWATALGLLASRDEFRIDYDGDRATVPGSAMGDMLLRHLQSLRPSMPLWDDSSWDPMQAASAFVGLQPPADPDAD